ncbi:MAG: HAD family hydrolase [Victivallaceae bacterium]
MNTRLYFRKKTLFSSLFFLGLSIFFFVGAGTADPLPSWQEGPAKLAIIGFVQRVTDEASPEFVPAAERIAVFDNDGTLWAEQPMYVQLRFALDRLKVLAPQHPEWETKEPFASLLRGDLTEILSGPDAERKILEVVMVTHAGITSDEFETAVKDWLAVARHPRTGKLYTEMVYPPMLELLEYLKKNDFKIFIVSGGGVEFMRAFAESVYGVPPERVIGSSVRMEYELKDGRPVLMRLPEINFIDDKAGKPVGIQAHIGRRPIAAFGNSDGDREMLEWTQAGKGARLMLLVHHDDAEREWAYGADSKVGTFSDSLAREAAADKWLVVSIKDDWRQVFPVVAASAAKE